MKAGSSNIGRNQTDIEKGLPRDPEAYLERARAFLKEKRYDAAETLVRIALDLRPVFFEGVKLLGDILQKSGRKKEGAEMKKEAKQLEKKGKETNKAFLQAIRKQYSQYTKNPEFWVDIGRRELQKGNLPQLIEVCMREAIRLDPECVEAWDILGLLLRTEMRFREAEKVYLKLTELVQYNSSVWHYLAVTLVYIGKGEDAVEAMNESLHLDPYDSIAWRDFGIILWELSRLEESEKAFRKSIELEPNNSQAVLGLTSILLLTGKKDEAEELYKSLIKHGATISVGENLLDLEAEDLNNDEKLVISVIASQNATSPETAFGPLLMWLPPFIPEILNPLKAKGYIVITVKGGMFLTEKGISLVKKNA